MITAFCVFLSFVVPYYAVAVLTLFRDMRSGDSSRSRQHWVQFWKFMPRTVANLLCLQLPFVVISRPHMTQDLPSVAEFFTYLLLCTIGFECCFYVTHRLLHVPFIYSKIHRVHHTMRDTIAVGAIYCHPAEHLFCNILSAVWVLFLLRVFRGPVPIMVLCAWSCMTAVSSSLHHDVPWSAVFASHHPLHHKESVDRNFSFLGVLDQLCGTN
jgi:sterol desaturase/sphingolipid hydroxylase (fatty acid hydroxylase superfamily)